MLSQGAGGSVGGSVSGRSGGLSCRRLLAVGLVGMVRGLVARRRALWVAVFQTANIAIAHLSRLSYIHNKHTYILSYIHTY